MNSRLSNLTALLLVGTAARLAGAQPNLAPATATETTQAPPPGVVTSDAALPVASEKSGATTTSSGTTALAPTTTAPLSPTEVAGPSRLQPTPEAPLAIGLEPGAPYAAKLPTGATPSLSQSKRLDDWRFDFHGYLNLPLSTGINEREQAFKNQKVLVLHTPPRIPGDLESFDYIGLLPQPYAQLNFLYGNSFVTATVIIAARSVAEASSHFNPPDQMGVHDAFLTFRLLDKPNDDISLDVGAFSNRYGIMGEYDLGRYGTPLIARLGGIGTTATARFARGPLTYLAEAGVMGQTNKAPVGEEPGSWNGYSDPNTGTSYALHGHAALQYQKRATLGLHAIHTLVQDDRVAQLQKDGTITVLGAEGRLSVGRFGHLYLGYAHTDAENARGVSSIIRVLNAKGGPGLMTEYFGPNSGGNGSLDTLGLEYDLSLGNLLRHPGRFDGNGPDINLGAFGIFTAVGSDEDEFDGVTYDGVNKFKYGLEAAYSMLSWFGVGARYDRVLGDLDDPTRTYAAMTGRLIFRSDWQAQDQVSLSYSHLVTGSSVWIREGSPPTYNPVIEPDKDVVTLNATMWW